MNQRLHCTCGHESGVHDAVGCAAWLPAYGESAAGAPARCTCRVAHGRSADEAPDACEEAAAAP